MSNATIGQLSGLAGRLVAEGLITTEPAADAQKEAANDNMPFVQYLVERSGVNGQHLAEVASQEFGVPLFDIKAFNRTNIPEGIIEAKLVGKHHALPLFRRGSRLFIAVSDPTNLAALDEIKFHTGINTDAILVEETALNQFITEGMEAQDNLDDGFGYLDDVDLDGVDIESRQEGGESVDGSEGVEETPIVRFVNKVLIDAIKQGASDIHFEPYENNYRVRFRTDGILSEVVRPPKNLAPRLAARLKVMSQMDISERRVPQDGRIQMKFQIIRSTTMATTLLVTFTDGILKLRKLTQMILMTTVPPLRASRERSPTTRKA